MKKYIVFAFIVIVAVAGYLYVSNIDKRPDIDAGSFDVVHDFKYSFNLKNITPREIANAKVWVSAPVAFYANQKSISLESNQAPGVFRDENNNQEMYFNYKKISKNEIKHVVVDMQIAFSKQANKSSDISLDQYLSPEKYIDTRNSEIIEKSTALKSDDAEGTTQNILTWLKKHKELMSAAENEAAKNKRSDALAASAEVTGHDLNDTSALPVAKPDQDLSDNSATPSEVIPHDLSNATVEGIEATKETSLDNTETDSDIGALAVLNKQHNSKSGLLYLYLALNRSLGIPSRGIVGFDFSDTNNFSASDATLWAEYYDAGYWHLVNLDDFKKVNDASKFVAFKVINKLPGQAGWKPYSVLHNEAAFVVDVSSVKLTVR